MVSLIPIPHTLMLAVYICMYGMYGNADDLCVHNYPIQPPADTSLCIYIPYPSTTYSPADVHVHSVIVGKQNLNMH